MVVIIFLMPLFGYLNRVRISICFDTVAQKDYIRGMNTKDSYVRARVDNRLKRETDLIFHRMGLSTTEAIRLFLVQVRIQKALPFRVGLSDSMRQNDDILLPVAKRQEAIDLCYDN